MIRVKWVLALVLAVVALAGLVYALFPGEIQALIVRLYDPGYVAGAADPPPGPQAAPDPDAGRPKVPISLKPVATGLSQITDVAFPPGQPGVMLVAQKSGEALWVDRATDKRGILVTIPVVTASEQGLLGVAFHPKFPEDPRIFFNVVVGGEGEDRTQILAAPLTGAADLKTATLGARKILLEVPQPYANHNAGELAFGPDGLLYIGLGDGGWAGDPQGNGQNPATLLGSMLRIDVDGPPAPGLAYGIPKDNPFLGREGARPELYAIGLRNPWRYSFAPDGRLIVADVGQNLWEEITLVGPGENHGWNTREARHCYPRDATCERGDRVDPIYEYGRGEGQSVTGGFVYTGAAVPALRGLYVFGDFVSGRIWAIDLPEVGGDRGAFEAKVRSLGRHNILLSTFGQDAAGEIYVGDYQGGVVSQIVPAEPDRGQ